MGPNDCWGKIEHGGLTVHTWADLEELFEYTLKSVDVYERNSEGTTLAGKKALAHEFSCCSESNLIIDFSTISSLCSAVVNQRES